MKYVTKILVRYEAIDDADARFTEHVIKKRMLGMDVHLPLNENNIEIKTRKDGKDER